MPVIRTGVLYKMACICHKPLLFHVIILWALAQYKERGGGGEEEREGQTAQVVCGEERRREREGERKRGKVRQHKWCVERREGGRGRGRGREGRSDSTSGV